MEPRLDGMDRNCWGNRIDLRSRHGDRDDMLHKMCQKREDALPTWRESNIITITVNDSPLATCSSVDGDCNNNNEASASVSASGGTAPYTLRLEHTVRTTASISGLDCRII